MNVSRSFILQEFVPKSVFDYFGDYAVNFIDPKLIALAQFIRDTFGKVVIINNWHTGGQYSESGLREHYTTTGAKFSQHKFGRAIDIKIPGLLPSEIYTHILANEKLFLDAGLTTMENIAATLTWNHLDIRKQTSDKIVIVNP